MERYRKAVIAGSGFVVIGVATALTIPDIIPDEYLKWATLLIALGTAYGVYQVPNASNTPTYINR